MKKTFKGILAVLLCASLLCGCAADEKPSGIPQTSEAVNIGSDDDMTEAPDNGNAPAV